MSHAEDVLYANLTDVESIESIANEDLDLSIIPNEFGRTLVQWCVEYFFTSGKTRAPSLELIHATWGHRLNDAGISLGDGTETDTVRSALHTLRDQYLHFQHQRHLAEMAREMSEADPIDRHRILNEHAQKLFTLVDSTSSKAAETEAKTSVGDQLASYITRQQEGLSYEGMSLGIPEIDEHIYGIHPGEILVFAAISGAGKSWAAAYSAIKEWRAGRDVVLFTLENTVEDTWDRVICIAAGIDYGRWQRGTCNEGELMRAHMFLEEVETKQSRLHVISPDPHKRTPTAVIQKAFLLDVDSVIIDQLTFMEHPSPGRKPRHEVVRDIMRELAVLITTGSKHLPVILLHQINRDGYRHAMSTGKLEMIHLAEGAEVERTATFVLGLLRSKDQVASGEATIQMLKARRVPLQAWELTWEPQVGFIRVIDVITGD